MSADGEQPCRDGPRRKRCPTGGGKGISIYTSTKKKGRRSCKKQKAMQGLEAGGERGAIKEKQAMNSSGDTDLDNGRHLSARNRSRNCVPLLQDGSAVPGTAFGKKAGGEKGGKVNKSPPSKHIINNNLGGRELSEKKKGRGENESTGYGQRRGEQKGNGRASNCLRPMKGNGKS